MSKDIIVLAPNGRRQTIHCTPDTCIIQVLEDVCRKQGFQPSDYDLKHHNHILDLSTTIRFANLPNKATIEMVETEKRREESIVTVGLLLEDGDRRTADFAPNTSLLDLLMSLAGTELSNIQNPSVVYMRQEVTGVTALKEKTLRMLGLIKGRAILRLLDKAEVPKQANVSAVYRRPFPENPTNKLDYISTAQTNKSESDPIPGPSHKTLDPVSLIKSIKNPKKTDNTDVVEDMEIIHERNEVKETDKSPKDMVIDEPSAAISKSNTSITAEVLERRLNIEEEVTFLGTHKAIVYMQPDVVQDEIDDLPDDFYELTIEEVRKIYNELQKQRISLENTPLITSSKRSEFEKQTSEQKLNVYKNVVVRIHFPDGIILQGVFLPTDTIQQVMNFVREYIRQSDKPFQIFTTPLKENLDPKMTLHEANFVPCVYMHFKWLEENSEPKYLKEEIYSKKTTCDAASILASKYRAPSRRKPDVSETNPKKHSLPSTSNNKVPKWFKN